VAHRRRLGNESFFGAPQLKRDSLGGEPLSERATVRGGLIVGLFIVWGLVGNHLALRAFRYRVDPNAPRWGYQIWYSRFFTAEGQGPRRRAVWFFVLGGLVIVVIWWLFGSR
jgi:hypothetical protein